MNLRAWVTVAAMLGAVVLVALAYTYITAPDEDIDGLIKADYDCCDHTNDNVDYAETPPLGGKHDYEFLTCDAYDRPVREEDAVHAVEHGAIWLTYDPGLSKADVAALVEAAPDDAIVSPYDDLPSPVVATAWNRQIRLDGVDDPRLEEFVDTFRDGHTAPEKWIGCRPGVVAYEDED